MCCRRSIVDNEQGIRRSHRHVGHPVEANFHIISGQVTAARNIYKCVHKAGLDVTELDPGAACLGRGRAEPGGEGGGRGAGGHRRWHHRHRDLLRQHHPAYRGHPLGGNVVTEDIRQGCRSCATRPSCSR